MIFGRGDYRFYDDLSRLIEADYNNGANVYNYGYDVAGNMVDYDGVTRTFNAANQMTNDGTNSLTYDNNGNLTGNGSDSYTWDRANRLLSVGNHSYVYDGLGNRVQQTVSSVVTDYLNDVQPGLTKLLAQSAGSNVDRFVHGVRGIHAVDDGTNWNYYAQDGLGSVRAIVDDAGVVQSSMSYDPYGNPIGSYGTGFGFTGEQTDANGSVFLRARYYEPSLGTFIKRDPAETPNRYGYVSGNPINRVDPTGLMPVGYGTASSGNSINGVRTNIKWNPIYWNLENPFVVQRMNSGLCNDNSVGINNKLGKRHYSRGGGSDIRQDSSVTPTDSEKPLIIFLGGSYSDGNCNPNTPTVYNPVGECADIEDPGPSPFDQIGNWIDYVSNETSFTPLEYKPVTFGVSGFTIWHTDNPSNPNVGGVLAVRYFGSKEQQAHRALIHAVVHFPDVIHNNQPVIIIGYSTGADAALFLANSNSNNGDTLNITHLVFLGGTLTGSGVFLETNAESIMSEALDDGIEIIFADDSNYRQSEDPLYDHFGPIVNQFIGEDGFDYSGVRPGNTHFDNNGSTGGLTGTNNNPSTISSMFEDLGIPRT